MGLHSPFHTNHRPSPSTMPMPKYTTNKQPTDSYEWPARPVSPAHDTDNNDTNDLNDDNNQDAPHIEQLLVNHLHFAHAIRKNDAAMILQYLSKDVTLISMDGVRHEGQSAVLAHLVGAYMTKISSNLRVKGCPTRSGACQSTFIYEHGVVFKDPLYMEVLDWKPNSVTVERIVHAALPDAKSGKTPQDFGKSSSSLLSFATRMSGDDEISGGSDGSEARKSENNNTNTAPRKVRCRRLKSNSSADRGSAAMTAVAAAGLRLSSSSISSQSGGNEAAVEPLTACAGGPPAGAVILLAEISCIGLTPIRKRKTVNPFVILQCPDTGATWKSPVKRRDSNPNWNQIPLKIPAHKRSKVVEISLWDHTFFRSVKVAGAALVGSDLLKEDAEFSTNIQLERFDGVRAGGEPQYMTMRLRFVRPCGGGMAVPSSDEVVQGPAHDDDIETKQLVAPRSAMSASFKWLLMDPFMDGRHASVLLMLVRAAIVAAIVWNVFHVTFVWPKPA